MSDKKNKVEVTIKKMTTSEPNVSKRTITYDVYHNGKYHTTFNDIFDALAHQEKMEKGLEEAVLTIQQRQARARIIRRNKPKIERARELAKRKLASPAAIRKRAFVEARRLVRKRFAGKRGAEYEKLGPTEKMAIDRAIDQKQALIRRIALRLIPKIKQAETRRLQAYMKGQAPMHNYGAPEGHLKESVNNNFNEAFGKKKVQVVVDGEGQDQKPKTSKPPEGVIIHGRSNVTKPAVQVGEGTQQYKSLMRKSEKSNIPFEILEEVYGRGLESWSEDKTVTQEQYAFARVNSFISKGKTYFEDDSDLHEKMLKENTAVTEDLRTWFKEKWVRMDTKGNIKGDCAREEGEGKPKCLPLDQARAMGKGDRAAAVRRKRREDPVADRQGKGNPPINVATEEYVQESSEPTNPALWSQAKALAKKKFDVYPSAYANGWAAKWYKSKGGKWTVGEETVVEASDEKIQRAYDRLVHRAEKRHGPILAKLEGEAEKTKKQRLQAYNTHMKAQEKLGEFDKFKGQPEHKDVYDIVAKKAADAEASFVDADKKHSENLSRLQKARTARMDAIKNTQTGRHMTSSPSPDKYANALQMGRRGYGEEDTDLGAISRLFRREEKIEGTNCKNCLWWKEDTTKPVQKDELNSQGGLKSPNNEYTKMAKEVDLVTLPGNATVKEKAFCDNENVHDWVTERMCCALWDAKGVKRDYKGTSPVMEANETKKTKEGTFQLQTNGDLATIYKTHDKFGNKMMKPGFTGVRHKAGNVKQIKPIWDQMESIDEHVKCGTDECCGKCNPSLNESFSIQYAAGVGVTLTAKDLGMKIQGGFQYHPSVLEPEEVISEDEELVLVPAHTAINPRTGEEVDVKGTVRRKKRRVEAE